LLTEQDWQDAIASAIGYFTGSREPFALLWLDVMHRRFGIAQFADALQRFDRALVERPKESPLLRVFRRMADRDNPLRLEDMDAVTHPSDRLVVCALYCDRLDKVTYRNKLPFGGTRLRARDADVAPFLGTACFATNVRMS